MTRVWTMALSALLAWGCQSGEEPVRGANRGVQPQATYAPAPSKPDEPVETPSLELLDNPGLLPGLDQETEELERDLSEELKSRLGTPTDCVRDFSASSPTTLRINVSAIVRPTGMVIQPSVYGSGLSNAARQCIERRVSVVRLQPLDDTVSKSVSTVVEIEYEPPVVIEADPGVPEPQLRNVRESLPKRPDIPPSGKEINRFPTDRWISGGFDGGRPIQDPNSRKISGPKPRAIDGYEVDENAQDWSNR